MKSGMAAWCASVVVGVAMQDSTALFPREEGEDDSCVDVACQEFSFANLPIPVLLCVMGHLGAKDVSSCASVCHHWAHVTRLECVWAGRVWKDVRTKQLPVGITYKSLVLGNMIQWGAAFQARFHVVFQVANDELSHRQILIWTDLIS